MNRALSACKHRVSGSLSLPFRGSFHLSLTVLFAIGHHQYFLLPTGFLVSCGTLDLGPLHLVFAYGALTRSGSAFQPPSANDNLALRRSTTPANRSRQVWALPLSLAATEGIDVSFLSSGYLDVSVPRVPPVHLWIQCTVTGHYSRRVSPFGNPWINAYLQLPMAYRSSLRPSSAVGT